MFCKNRITLIGFIGKDAQTRYTPSGTAYTRFSLATNVSWKDKATDAYQTRTEWHSIVFGASSANGRARSRRAPSLRSRGNCGIANSSRRAPTAMSVWRKFTPHRF